MASSSSGDGSRACDAAGMSQLEQKMMQGFSEITSALMIMRGEIQSLKEAGTLSPSTTPGNSPGVRASPCSPCTQQSRLSSPSSNNTARLSELSKAEPSSPAPPAGRRRIGQRDARMSCTQIQTPQARLWSLVEGDKDMRNIIKDVRTRIKDFADKNEHVLMTQRRAKQSDMDAHGTLYVLLLRGTGLLASDANGLSDPYCKLSLHGTTHKSKKVLKTLNPLWTETFAFPGVLRQIVAAPLHVRAFDWDQLSRDDPLGSGWVDLAASAEHPYFDGVRRDHELKLDTQGSVTIKVWWEPEDKASAAGKAKPTLGARLRTLGARLVPRQLRARGCLPAVMHPDSKFRSTWNVLLAFLILYCGFAVPLEIAFETDMVGSMCRADPQMPHGPTVPRGECSPYLTWFWLNFLVDMVFIADIWLNFRTGYVHEGHFVSDGYKVAKNYASGSFVIDTLGSFPLNILMMLAHPDNPYGDAVSASASDAANSGGIDAGRANRVLRLMRLAKLAKLARMRKLAKYLANFEEFLNPGVLAVFKLVFITWFCCHLFGCLWWMVSDLELMEEESGAVEDPWLASPWYAHENGWHPPRWLKQEAALGMKYMHAFFWGAGMVTSLVPRDIEPLTILESLVTTGTMFFGLLLNAFVISSLNQALASMNSKRELTGKQLEQVKSYLLVKSIPSDLRSRILEYFEYLLSSSAALDTISVFEHMPPALAAQLSLTSHRRIAARCALFRDVSNPSLVSLVSELKALVFVPSQIIVREGLPLAAVYFINKGVVQLERMGAPCGTLTNHDNFGVDDFYQACVQSAHAIPQPTVSRSAHAVTYCDVMSLAVDQLQDMAMSDTAFQKSLRKARSSAAEGKAARSPSPQSLTKRTLSMWAGRKMSFSPDPLRRSSADGGRRGSGSRWSTRRGSGAESESKRESRACVNLARAISKRAELAAAIDVVLNAARARGEAPSLKTVRQRVEEQLGLRVDSLKERRKEINALIDAAVAAHAGSSGAPSAATATELSRFAA